jgi:hypothetical protein
LICAVVETSGEGERFVDETVRVLLRVPPAHADDLLRLLDADSDSRLYEVLRVSAWRSAGVPWSEILVGLSSVGSVSAIASVVRAWLESTKAKIEVIAEATGERLTFEGPAARIPADQIRGILSRSALPNDHPEDQQAEDASGGG